MEFGIFVVVAFGGLSTLLWLLSAVIGRRIRAAKALSALVAPVLDVAVAALILSGSLRSCPDREMAIIAEIPTYAGAEMTFDYESSSGACSGSLDVTATADEVFAHYRSELERTVGPSPSATCRRDPRKGNRSTRANSTPAVTARYSQSLSSRGRTRRTPPSERTPRPQGG